MALAPGSKLGVYEVTAKIGAGGMGEVYRAHDTTLDRDVAIKMSLDNAIERVVKHDRTIVLGALIAVVALSWVYVLAGAGMSMSAFEMTRMSAGKGGMAMMVPAVWDLGYAGVMFIMWWVMMIAMMLPSATPMVLLFAAVNRKQKQEGNPYVATAHFASAYLIVWAGFSVVAVALQWGLEALALLSPMLISASVVFGGGLLLGAPTSPPN